MPATLNPMITDAGLAAAINAKNDGLTLAITHIALGTGKYDSSVSGAGMTAMAAYKEKQTIAGGQVQGTGGFRVSVLFDSWVGSPSTYEATELGFYAGDPDAGGVLFAVWSHPSDVLVQRNSLTFASSYTLQLTRVPPGSIVIEIDPDASAALALLSLHEGATDPHPGYVKKVGDVSTGPQIGVTADLHDVSNKFATTEYAKRLGVSYPASGGILIDASPAALLASDFGRWADIKVNGAVVNMPLSSSVPVGASIQFRVSAASATIVAAGEDKFTAIGGLQSTGFPVMFGESVTITRNGTKEWSVTAAGFRMPAGIVSYFAGNVAPPGWLKLNGSLLSRAAYPALWTYAQSTQGVVSETNWWDQGYSGRFSSGVSGSDFRLPDLRGVFLRAFDDGRGIDAGREYGRFQDHANRAHAHALNDPGHTHTIIDAGHAHGVYDPGHIHSAWTDAQGQHVHGASPGIAEGGGGFMYGGSAGIGNNGTMQGGGATGGGFGNRWSMTGATGAAGSHGHNVGIGANGTGIGIYGAFSNISAQARGTGVTMQSDGSEARPRNVAWSLFIKF